MIYHSSIVYDDSSTVGVKKFPMVNPTAVFLPYILIIIFYKMFYKNII